MHPLHRLTYLSALAAAATLLLACTSPDATPTATPTVTASPAPTVAPLPSSTPTLGTPTPTPTPALPPLELIDGWPRNAVGPLVLYQRQVGSAIEVVVFDLGSARSLTTLSFSGRHRADIALAGTRLIENRGDSLWLHELDRQSWEVFRSEPGSYIERFASSPDGSLIALNRWAEPPGRFATNVIEVIAVESGELIASAHQDAATTAGFTGIAGPAYWLDDASRVVLFGYTYSENGGGLGTLALDGTIRLTDQGGGSSVQVDPTGGLATVAFDRENFHCALAGYGGAQRLTLVDPDTGRELNSVETRWYALGKGVWSPDGTEYRYPRRQLSDEIGEALEQAAANGQCGEHELLEQAWAAPRTWDVLSVDGSAPLSYDSPLEVQQRWYGDRTITFHCGAEIRIGDDRRGWWSPPFEDQDCRDQPIEVRVGDQPIGSGRYPWVLGFIEPPTTTTAPASPTTPPVIGISEVDAVIEAVFDKDGKALADLVAYTPRPCSEHAQLGAPPTCDSLGIPDGTLVDTVGTSVCDGVYAPPAQAAEFLRSTFGEGAPELRFAGLYEPTDASNYIVMFRATTIPDGWTYSPYRALTLRDAHIVHVSGGCDAEYPRDESVARWIVTPEQADWRVALAGTPALVDLITSVLSGPESVVDLAQTIEAHCSFHGELLSPCEAVGLGIHDQFEAIVVSGLLHCEACEVPPDRVERTISHIYRSGGVPSQAFWSELEEPPVATALDPGVTLVAAWLIDDSTRDLIGERWQERLSATHLLAFKSTRPDPSDEAATGFLLFVDPSAGHPIAIIESTSETWTAADTAQQLGRGAWQPLYLRP